MVRVASRASAAMTSAWEAVLSRVMLVAVWPAGTSSMGIPVWRSVLLDTMSSGAGDASASPSARLVITGILSVNLYNIQHKYRHTLVLPYCMFFMCVFVVFKSRSSTTSVSKLKS